MAISLFHSSEIECDGCATAIKNTLGKIDGVTSVEVEVAGKLITIDHSSNVSPNRLMSALDGAGFPVD